MPKIASTTKLRLNEQPQAGKLLEAPSVLSHRNFNFLFLLPMVTKPKSMVQQDKGFSEQFSYRENMTYS